MDNIERSRSSPMQSDNLVRNRFQQSNSNRSDLNRQIQAETKKILRQMPSRNRMDFINLARKKVLAKRSHREFERPPRKGSIFGSINIKSGVPFSSAEDLDVIDSIKERLENENIDLSSPHGLEQVEREFREMKVPLAAKRKWKRLIIDSPDNRVRRNVVKSTTEKCIFISEQVKSFFRRLDFWHNPIYHVTGVHGSGVTSYFQFLRWLFWLNLPLSLIVLCFIMIPQWLWTSSNYQTLFCADNTTYFDFSNFLTGDGWFRCTALFYGYYTNETIQLGGTGAAKYSMPTAYFFTIWICYIVCIVAVLFSALSLYRKNYIETVNVDVMRDVYISKIFCGWDYQIQSFKSAAQKRSAFVKGLKEHLAAEITPVYVNTNQRYMMLARRFGLLFIMVGILVCASLCIYIVSDVSNPFPNASSHDVVNVDSARNQLDSVPVLNSITLALTVTGINYIIPYLFHFLIALQNYSPRTELYISLATDFLLNATTLVTMFYFWSTAIQLQSSVSCWETILGEQIYRLTIMDFIFFLFFALVSEILRRFVADSTKMYNLRPSFHIGRSTLHLAYVQALCWLGAYFCPMAYFLNALKLFIYFYVKFVCATYACQPTVKLWRATQARVVFFFVLCAFLILSVGCVAFANYNLLSSKDCGPMRQYNNDYDVVINILASWSINDRPDSLLTVALAVVTSEGMVVSFILVLCVVVYWQRRRAEAWSTMVDNMKEQLVLESKDKQYLLQIMQKLIEYDLTMRRKPNNYSRSHENETAL